MVFTLQCMYGDPSIMASLFRLDTSFYILFVIIFFRLIVLGDLQAADAFSLCRNGESNCNFTVFRSTFTVR